MFRTKLIVMSVIIAMAFCLPGAAESRGDHHWKWKKHRFGGWPFRALLNNLQELENRLSALEAAPTTQSDPGTTAGPQVSFLATVKVLADPFATSSRGTVIFEEQVHDEPASENNYNPGSGTFTVPVSGTYQCSSVVYFNPLTADEGSTATLQILRNEGDAVFDLGRTLVMHPNPINQSFPNYSVGGGITLQLDQGQRVNIFYSGPAIGVSAFPGHNEGGTRFSCHQLY